MDLRKTSLIASIAALLFHWSNGVQTKCRVKYDLSRCYSVNKTYQKESIVCHNSSSNHVCDKSFNITYINMEPYNVQLLKYVFEMCCGDCNTFNITHSFVHLWHITPEIMEQTQLVFPVLGPSTADRLHGHYFLPLVEVPVVYYITERTGKAVAHFIYSLLRLWPAVLLCLMIALVAGFIGWISETWTNDQFPRPFLIGWFEGFWWSFITMTTVGYGDRVPKTFGARVFSVFWIMTGIVSFSALTATFASQVHELNHPPTPVMAGKKVGSMRHRTFEGAVIADGGGLLVDVGGESNTDAVFQLIRLLRRGDIDGFILDRYTFITVYTYISSLLESHAELWEDIEYFKMKTVQTEKRYHGQRLSFGVLLRDKEDYEYFADFIAANEVTINGCSSLWINDIYVNRGVHLHPVDDKDLLLINGGLFWPVFIAASLVIFSICCFGFVYEIKRHFPKESRKL